MRSIRTFRVLVRTGQVHAIDIPARSKVQALSRAGGLWNAGRVERFDCIHHKVAELFEIDDVASDHLLDVVNEDRSSWAGEALRAFAAKTGSEMDAEALLDLVADLGHYADENGIAFLDVASRAIGCWAGEQNDPDGEKATPSVTITIGRQHEAGEAP